jgi:alpha-mannosidase
MSVVEGSGPNRIDEIKEEDYPFYREVQMWLHQRRGSGAIAIATIHPAFHWGHSGLEAVLLRTPKSCGDPRFHWENSGRHEFKFRMKLGESIDPTGWAFDMGQQTLCPSISHVLSNPVKEQKNGTLPLSDTFIKLNDNNLILSSVYPDDAGIIIRFFETEGKSIITHLNVLGMKNLDIIHPDGKLIESVTEDENGWPIYVKPYEIITMRCHFNYVQQMKPLNPRF